MQILNIIPKCYKVTYCLSESKEGHNAKKRKSPPLKTHNNHVKFLRNLAPPLMAALLTLTPIAYIPESLGQTVDVQRGASLFRRTCIGCHDGGGNIIQPGASLFLKDLQRNRVDGEDYIYGITYYGKGRMPGYGENCAPRGQCTFGARLSDEEIRLLAEFVKLQADQGWPNITVDDD